LALVMSARIFSSDGMSFNSRKKGPRSDRTMRVHWQFNYLLSFLLVFPLVIKLMTVGDSFLALVMSARIFSMLNIFCINVRHLFSDFFSSELLDSVSTRCSCATSIAYTKSDIRT